MLPILCRRRNVQQIIWSKVTGMHRARADLTIQADLVPEVRQDPISRFGTEKWQNGKDVNTFILARNKLLNFYTL